MDKTCTVCHESMVQCYGEWQWNIRGQVYRLSSCPICGSVFTDPLPDNAALKKLYKTEFDYQWYRDYYIAKIRDCRQRIEGYRRFMGRRVLDFGGGLGYFSQLARKQGYHSITYDPYTTRGDLQEKEWDTIVSLHMLEHSNNPDKTIRLIKSLLVPGGKLILAVPNFSCRGYNELGMYWVWAQPPLLHIFHFTATGLKSLLMRHGFIELQISYHERWDANLYTDLEKVEKFRKMDAAWSRKPFNSIPLYRKLIAYRNSFLRFKGLEKAIKNYNPDDENYAELQIVATKTAI